MNSSEKLLSYISKQMEVNARNSCSQNFYRRLKKYFKHRYQLDGTKAYALIKAINDLGYNGNDPLVLTYKAKIPKPENGGIEDSPHLTIPIMFEMLKYFESIDPIKDK